MFNLPLFRFLLIPCYSYLVCLVYVLWIISEWLVLGSSAD